jgi:hypothetical protein
MSDDEPEMTLGSGPTEKLSRPPDDTDRSEQRSSASASQDRPDSGGSAAAEVGLRLVVVVGCCHEWLGQVSTAAHFTLAYNQQSRGSELILGWSMPRRINPSRVIPIFSITRADAVLSTSHTAQTRYIAGCSKT